MEAPKFMRWWAGVSTIAGALRKKVWIDMDLFRWNPNLYVIFVAPPGIVTKSTTADLGMDLLREVPGIKFGPNNITWQALVTAFADASESFEYHEEWHPMSAITLVSRELGSLLNPKDQDLVNLFIELWDGLRKYEKTTKMSGNDLIEAPWINMLGATTPTWIADNVPKSAVGGGLVSRCVFLYAEEKENYVPYPKLVRPVGNEERRAKLVQDLEHISLNICGEYELTPETYEWGSEWYVKMWKTAKVHYDDEQIMGYLARKQTHAHKLAMILAASQRDALVITIEDLQMAVKMLDAVEGQMHRVFSRIGRTEESLSAERLLGIIARDPAGVKYEEVYRAVYTYFPQAQNFEAIVAGLIRSGQVELTNGAEGPKLRKLK
jgi:hypothetical protein